MSYSTIGRAGLALLAICLATVPVTAGEIHIPDNQPAIGSPNSWPFETHTQWRYQLLIPAAQLSGKPFALRDLAVAPGSLGNGTWSATQFQVRVAHTTRASLSPTFAVNLGSSPSVLYDGAISFTWRADAWAPLGLSRAFQYDGSSSLVIEIRYRGGPGRNGGLIVRSDTTSVLARCYTHTGAVKDPYDAATCITPVPGPRLAMKVRLTTVDTQIVASGSGEVGSTVDLDLLAPAWPGEFYQVGTSFGPGPTVVGNRLLGLAADDMLALSVSNLAPGLFRDFAGKLDGEGRARAAIHLPNLSSLTGLRLHTAFLVTKLGEPFNVADVSETLLFTVR